MAEFLVRITDAGPDPKSQDGDIICSFNKNRIEWCHVDMICNWTKESFNSDGLRPIDCMADFYQSKRYKFKFQRISATEIKRITLSNMNEEVLGPTPNINGECIDVPLFLYGKKGRLKHPKHRIFGAKGNEYWYGGKTDFSLSCRDTIWAEIEARNKGARADSQKWPFGYREFKEFLIVPCDDFTDDEGADYESPIYDDPNKERPIVLKKRKWKIDWRNLPGVSSGTINKILDINITMDFRKFNAYDRSTICLEKT